MQPLADAGYFVIAMDVRGFGRSDSPADSARYRVDHIVSDMEAVLDHFGYEQAILCGHDWGGIIVWHAARMMEARASKIISISTPHIKRPPVDPIAIFKKRYGDEHYFVHFNERLPGSGAEADALFAKDVDGFFRFMFRGGRVDAAPSPTMTHIPKRFEAFVKAGSPPQKGQVLSDEDRAVFVDAYTRSGFTGGINLYRNTTANWELSERLPEQIKQPTLMISPEDDMILPPRLTDPMVDMVPDLTRVTISNCGHWAMWEQPEAVTDAILNWLG